MFTRQPIEEHEDYDDDGWEQELATATDDNDVSTNSVCADAQLPAAFVAQINDVIENQLGGTAFVKLNWSSPRVTNKKKRFFFSKFLLGCYMVDGI